MSLLRNLKKTISEGGEVQVSEDAVDMNIIRVEEEIEMLKEIMSRSLDDANLGSRFITRTFDTFDESRNKKAYDKALEYVSHFKSTHVIGKGLLIMGDVGTGKTHIAAAIAHYLAEHGIGVKFGNITDIMHSIKKEFRSEQDTLSDIKKMPLLVIDDLGKEQNTDWQKEIIYNIVNYRYERNLPLVFTTNLGTEELNERLGQATMSRIFEICEPVVMIGEDYRTT